MQRSRVCARLGTLSLLCSGLLLVMKLGCNVVMMRAGVKIMHQSKVKKKRRPEAATLKVVRFCTLRSNLRASVSVRTYTYFKKLAHKEKKYFNFFKYILLITIYLLF